MLPSIRLEQQQRRKPGRPRGPTSDFTYITEVCRVTNEVVPPFKRQRTPSRSRAADQVEAAAESPVEHSSSSFTAESAALQYGESNQLPNDSLLDPPIEPEAAELSDLAQYASKPSGTLGSNFLPVNHVGPPANQACFCLPHWNQRLGKLDLQAFHLPGIRMASFEDGEHLTWWCDCAYSLESAREAFANHDFPDRSSAWLDGRAEKCCHIKALEASC